MKALPESTTSLRDRVFADHKSVQGCLNSISVLSPARRQMRMRKPRGFHRPMYLLAAVPSEDARLIQIFAAQDRLFQLRKHSLLLPQPRSLDNTIARR